MKTRVVDSRQMRLHPLEEELQAILQRCRLLGQRLVDQRGELASRATTPHSPLLQTGQPIDDSIDQLVADAPHRLDVRIQWRASRLLFIGRRSGHGRRGVKRCARREFRRTLRIGMCWRVMNKRFLFGPPKHTLLQISGSRIWPIRVPSGAKMCTPSLSVADPSGAGPDIPVLVANGCRQPIPPLAHH